MSELSRAVLSLADLREVAEEVRALLEPVYSPDTAAPGFPRTSTSAGQCAATAALLRQFIGGSFASAKVHGLSHWFNRIVVGTIEYDVDLTGDQFGRPTIQIARAGALYDETRERSDSELNDETKQRARVLATKAGLPSID
jgi:hypothetical protein